MSDRIVSAAGVPRRVRFFSPILQFLLAAGVPLGFNRLVTIPGRKSGLPRTTAVAVIEISGSCRCLTLEDCTIVTGHVAAMPVGHTNSPSSPRPGLSSSTRS